MARGKASKNVVYDKGVATCKCRCGWERSIFSGDSYRVKKLQVMCLKTHKRICKIAMEDDMKPPRDYNGKIVNVKTKEQNTSPAAIIQKMYKEAEKTHKK